MSGLVSQAAYRTPPKSVTATAITAATSTAAIDMTAYNGMWITFTAMTDTVYLRTGASDVGAATTSNGMPLAVGQQVDYFLPADGSQSYFRAISTLASTIFWAPSSDGA